MASVKQPKKLNYKLKIPRSLRDGTWQTSFNSSLTNRNRSKWKSKNSLNFASKKLFYKIYNQVVGDYVEAKKFSFCLHVQHEKLRHCPDSFFLLILFPTSQCFRMPGAKFLHAICVSFCFRYFWPMLEVLYWIHWQVIFCVYALKLRMCEYGILCVLEININGKFKRGHVESCPSTTKNIPPSLEATLSYDHVVLWVHVSN